jgi:tetratricopeptide (TPR) repeat protein
MHPDDELIRRYRDAIVETQSSHPSDDLWERFAVGEVTAHERQLIAAHVVECAACADVFRSVRLVRHEAAAFDPQAALAERQLAMATRAARGRAAMFLVAAAAAIAIAAGMPLALRYWQMPAAPAAAPVPTTESRLADDPAFRLEAPAVRLSPELLLSRRSAEGGRADALHAIGLALGPYREGRYREAAAALEAVSRNHPDVYEARMYAGVSLLLAGQPTEAVPHLQQALLQAPADWRDDIEWPLALAYAHAGRPSDAEPILTRLCANAGPLRARACAAAARLPR